MTLVGLALFEEVECPNEYFKIQNCSSFLEWDTCYNYDLFKWHVGMSMAVVAVGALVAALITLAFLGQMLCADCGSGERITSLCVYLFLMLSKWQIYRKAYLHRVIIKLMPRAKREFEKYRFGPSIASSKARA